jgi:hypothetical protein
LEPLSLTDLCLLSELPTLTRVQVLLDANNLSSIARAVRDTRNPMTSLGSLPAIIALSSRLPSHITTLQVTVAQYVSVHVQHLIVDLSSLLPNLTDLNFTFQPTYNSAVDLQSLRRLPRLARLGLIGICVYDHIVDAIGALSLTSLLITTALISAEALSGLANSASLSSLKELRLLSTIFTAAHFEQLSKFRALECLEANSVHLNSLHLLSTLSLTKFHLTVAQHAVTHPASASVFSTHLQSCRTLTELTLQCVVFTGDELLAFACGMKLKRIAFVHCAAVHPLSSLAPMKSLTELSIERCSWLRMIHLADLCAVFSLRSLNVQLPASEVEIAQRFLPPMLPMVKQFQIQACLQ